MRSRLKSILFSLAALMLIGAIVLLASRSAREAFLPLGPKRTKAQPTVAAVSYPSIRFLEFSPEDQFVRPVGRTYYDEETRWFSFSGCGLEFTCTGTALTLVMRVPNAESLAPNHCPRVAVLIDGERVVDTVLRESEQDVEVPLYAFDKQVTVRVVKLSESMYSCVGVSGISLYADRDIAPSPRKNQVIEYIGDSITCGFGIDHEKMKGEFSTKTEDYGKTYASLTAQALGAESYAIAYSGYGAYAGYTAIDRHNVQNTLPLYYDYTLDCLGFDGEAPKWEFESLPDLIVINLGTNDATYCVNKERRDKFQQAYYDFLEQVHAVNPGVPIVCILGDMNSTLLQRVEKAAKAFGKDHPDAVVFSTAVTFDMETLGSALHGHPNQASNLLAAQTFTSFLLDKIENNQFANRAQDPQRE